MTTMTIHIRNKIQNRLEQYTKRTRIRKDKVVETALDRFLAIGELDAIRNAMIPEAQKQGIYTDEDVFKALKSK